MPSLTTIIASGLGALLAVPALAIAGTEDSATTCLPAPTTSGTTAAERAVAAAATVPGWDAEQVAIAATIITVGQDRGVPARGWVIAVATAMQESRLRNLPGGDADPTHPRGPSGCADGAAVLARAATWLTAWNGGPVPYSMSTDPADWFGGYRRDCSGYASLALGLPAPGLNTAGLATRSTPIPKVALQPGDLLINPAPGGAGHVVIFGHWTNAAMTHFVAYEQSSDGGAHHRAIPYAYYHGYPMTPYRLVK